MESYDYFEHDADVGIIGRGETLEAAFESAAQAMFAILSETPPEPLEQVSFEFEEEDIELAFVRWLNLLVAHAQSAHLLLGRFQLKRDGVYWLGKAWGAPWQAKMERGVEVKGATLTMLSVTEKAEGWEARCIVDV